MTVQSTLLVSAPRYAGLAFIVLQSRLADAGIPAEWFDWEKKKKKRGLQWAQQAADKEPVASAKAHKPPGEKPPGEA